MNNIYGVSFKTNGKTYLFSGEPTFEVGSNVIVETEKGYQFGKIVQINGQVDINQQIKKIIRVATDKDYKQYLDNLSAAERSLKKSKEIAEELNLDMRFIDASFTFDKKQLLINFLASERIDFRELVKRLANIYKTRIELRQIGVRDKAKEIGGLGQCGRELCCRSFIETIDSITINMAKNQNIALNPNKINGACGRLLCCLTYEDDLYTELKKGMPQVNEFVDTDQGKGKVESIDVLSQTYNVIINNERCKCKMSNINTNNEKSNN